LLQAADAVLVWLVLRRLQIPGAWFAGLIFGIHPVHVESVAWISELKNVLAMFFTLLSILCLVEIDEKPCSRLVYFVTDLFRAGAAIENASRIHADGVSAVPLVASSRFRNAAPRGNSHVAILRYGCGVRIDHDLVSKSRDWRRRNHNRFGCAPFRKRGNGGLVVRGQSFSASASDGDLSALALRFARSVGVAAVDCAGFADWPALVFPKPRSARRFCCRRIFCDRALASDWARSNGLPAQWDAG